MKKRGIEFELSADYALFSDPSTRVGGEKCSYQVPTYESLRGATASIYWKPSIIWIIDEVRIMNRIRTETMGVRLAKYHACDKTQLSYFTYLKDVRYQVRAHFEWNDDYPELDYDHIPEKHLAIAKRSVARGGRRDVFLGTRECQAEVKPCVFGESRGYYDGQTMPFGLMYHGITYTPNGKYIRFWTPQMKDGVIHFTRPDKCSLTRPAGKSGTMRGSMFSGLAEFTEEEFEEFREVV